MSAKSEAPLWIEVKQSRYLLIFIILTHSLAIFSILMLCIDFRVILLLLMLVGCSLYFQLHRYKQGFYLFTLKHTAEFSWQILDRDKLSVMPILGSSVISAWLIVLHVQIDKQRRSLLVVQDAVPTDIYRQLRVTLNIASLTER
ncbi:MAG: hypothetical protein K9L22_05090 [Methylococcaceae bacterium]|nr:hypothetical protein [Methylococcaceae bacterium]